MTVHGGEPNGRGQSPSSLPLPVRSVVLAGLLVLAIFYTAYFAAPIVVPVIAATLLSLLFSPLVGAAVRKRVPRMVAAALVVGTLAAVLLGGAYWLAEPAAEWLRSAPTSLDEFRTKLTQQQSPLTDVREATEAVEQTVEEITGNGARAQRQVEIREPALLDTVMERVPVALGGIVMAMFLTFLLLVSGDAFMRKLVAVGGSFGARRRRVRLVRQMQSHVAHYLATVTAINVALGCIVGGVMYLLGMPNPALWGTLAGLLNFAPYVGPAVTTGVLFVAGVSVYDTLGAAVLPALVFLAITSLEGQVVTPLLLGQRLDLSPAVVFVSVILFGWIWGVPGAFMAVPLMTTVKVYLDSSARTREVGLLLGK
jgi:predicted PurR-regulated permease PerM